MSTTLLVLSSMLSCNDNELLNNKNEVQVKFIEEICCGNKLMTLKNELIESSIYSNGGIYKDSLLYVTSIEF